MCRIEYSPDMAVGAKYLRLWQLAFRADFGLASMADPFDMCTLMELILSQGFHGCELGFGFMCALDQSMFLQHHADLQVQD